MGKFDRFEQPSQKDRPWKVHPIWRGIGCLMLIIIPMMAWAAAYEFMRIAPSFDWFPTDRGMYANIDLDYLVLPFSLGQLTFTLLFTVMGFVVFSFIYSFVYRIAGPPKYGPTDAPPPKKRRKRRRR